MYVLNHKGERNGHDSVFPSQLIQKVFWFLDILVGIAAATLGLIAGAFGYTLMYGLVCPAVEIAAALLYLYWHFRKQLV